MQNQIHKWVLIILEQVFFPVLLTATIELYHPFDKFFLVDRNSKRVANTNASV